MGTSWELNWTPFSGSHETTIKIVFSEPAASAQICRFFCFFFLWRVFRQSDKFLRFFRRHFSHSAENTIKPVVSGTRAQKKGDMPTLELFCLSFLTVFGRPSFLPFLEVFMTDNLENRFLPVLGESASFRAFLCHVAETPIKLVKRGNGNRCFFRSCAWNPIKLEKKGGNGNGRNRRQHTRINQKQAKTKQRDPDQKKNKKKKTKKQEEEEEEEEEDSEEQGKEEEKKKKKDSTRKGRRREIWRIRRTNK